MVGRRTQNILLAAILLSASFVVPTATAQEPEFLLLGEDPAGDATIGGATGHLDTAADALDLSVRVDGDNMIFRLGLADSTTQAGQYCYFPAWEFGGEEYLAMSCWEMTQVGNDQTLSTVDPPATSRGTNVDHVGELRDSAAFFTIPLAGFGAALGDTIDDIYGMVYTSRERVVTDNIPDAKGDVDAAESLGSYVIGVGRPGASLDVGAVQVVFENLTAPSFLHEFANATSDDYTLNFTVPWQNITIAQTAEVHNGTANVTVLRDGEVVSAFVLDNQTAPASDDSGNETDGNATEAQAPVLSGLAGNWSVVIDYTDFVGTLGLTVEEHVEAPVEAPVGNETSEPALDADVSEDAPGVALPLMALGLLGAVFAARRRD